MGRLVLVVAGTMLLVLGVVTWCNVFRWWFFPNNFAVVEPNRIYRSAQLSRFLIRRVLTEHQIGLVIDLSRDKTRDAEAEQRITAELGIPRLNFVLRGNGTGRPECYPLAIAAIVRANAAGKSVLVHCQSGAQRTGGVIATYRILIQGWTPDAAFAEAEKYGHDPQRNPALIPFVQSHLNEWKAELAKQHILPGS